MLGLVILIDQIDRELSRGNERSIVTSVYNRIALDASSVSIQHVRLDKNNRFLSVIDSEVKQLSHR